MLVSSTALVVKVVRQCVGSVGAQCGVVHVRGTERIEKRRLKKADGNYCKDLENLICFE